MKKTPPAYLQQRGQPGDGDGGGGGGQRRENYREQRRNDNRHPQQVAQGDERGRNLPQNSNERREEEGAAGGQSLAPPSSTPHAPQQETADAQEGSFVVQHGLPPSSAYVNVAQNLAIANSDARGSRESQETERRVQGEFTEDRTTAVGVQEQRERSSACANTVSPQSELFFW